MAICDLGGINHIHLAVVVSEDPVLPVTEGLCGRR